MRPDPSAPAGWRAGPGDLDEWLARLGVAALAQRVPVLAYGSNRCPSKITWLRSALGLAGPVVVLRARTEGVAAVWAHGLRARDGQRPAVLAAATRAIEEHAVWLATPAQVAVLDECEGRGGRYRLARLHTGTVRTEDGAEIANPWCYLGAHPIRRPLLVDARPVRCVDVTQSVAGALVGAPAEGDGLAATTVAGAPHPDEWPHTLFVCGPLQPEAASWSLVAPHAVGPPRRAVAAGTVHDTGRGHPELLPGPGPGAPGWAVSLRDPAAALPGIDRHEGPEYHRFRTVLTDGTVAWAYACIAT